MAEQKMSAPAGMAGLVRYEEEKSKINIKPEYIFAGTAAIAEIELFAQGLFFIAVAFGILFGMMFYWLYRKSFQKSQSVGMHTTVKQSAPQPQQQVQQQ